jgi:hypothetical protein
MDFNLFSMFEIFKPPSRKGKYNVLREIGSKIEPHINLKIAL